MATPMAMESAQAQVLETGETVDAGEFLPEATTGTSGDGSVLDGTGIFR